MEQEKEFLKATVIQGTCGWLDQQYPYSVGSDAASRLTYYSKIWPSVEVNSSTYTIISPETTLKWCKSTPKKFLFHFKAYGLFCSRGIAIGQLPAGAKHVLSEKDVSMGGSENSKKIIEMRDMPDRVVDMCWKLFNESLVPVYQANKLGVILFQFHLSFKPNRDNLQYVAECRSKLDPRYRMAVEFRARAWVTDPTWKIRVKEMCTNLSIGWAAADELEHETYQLDKHHKGLPAGRVKRVLPIALEVTNPEFFYVRVHRRFGMEDRRLEPTEMAAWAQRLSTVASSMYTRQEKPVPIYFLWGTDHRNVPLMNKRSFQQALKLKAGPSLKAMEWEPDSVLTMMKSRVAAGSNTSKSSSTVTMHDTPISITNIDEEKVENKTKRFELDRKSKSSRLGGIKRYFSTINDKH
eukprot:jgi/Picsp_1/6623/NSC_03966-R1_protein